MKRTPRHRGFVGVDVVVSLALMLGVAALTAEGVMRYRHSQQESFWRQAALLAADAQLKRFEAGAPLDSSPPSGLIPEEIALKTRVEPGRGDWQSLRHVTVVATAALPAGRVIREQISAYLPIEVRP